VQPTRGSGHKELALPMPDEQTTHARRHEFKKAQRVIVLQVLRDDHPKPWTHKEIERKLADIDPDAIGVALERLHEQGVVRIKGNQIEASPCARHLDDLGFICI
jgi:hypothetical protein